MTKFLGCVWGALLGLTASPGSSAAVPPPLPWKPVPLNVGTVAPPANPSDWYSSGAWLDDHTVAIGIKSNASVEIKTLDGAVQQVLLNPDAPTAVAYGFGCAVHCVEGTLLVMASRFQGGPTPVLHVFQRPDPKSAYAPVARVELPGTLNSTTPAMRVWSESITGGIETRQLVVTWPTGNSSSTFTGHVVILRPTGPLQWDKHHFEFLTGTNNAVVGSIRGDTLALLPAYYIEAVKIWRRSKSGTWGLTGTWSVSNPAPDNQFSHPVVMDEDTVLVGHPSYLSGVGRLVQLKLVNDAWIEGGTIYPEHAVAGSKWASGLAAFDDTLLITRETFTDGLANLQVRKWNGDGTLGSGVDFVDVASAGNAFQEPLNSVSVVDGGHVMAQPQGPPFGGQIAWEPWNYLQARHALDLDMDGVPDQEAIAAALAPDCNDNGVPDAADISLGIELDGSNDGVPDACQSDCNENGTSDYQEIASQRADCNHNYMPDDCELSAGAPDADANGLPDDCGSDCNRNGVSDAAERAMALLEDCDANGMPDTCDRYQPLELGEQASASSRTIVIWFPVVPGHEIIDAVDFELGPTAQTPVVAVVQDRSGTGNGAMAMESDVLLVESPYVVSELPAPSLLTGPIQRCAFRPVDLTGMPAFWVVISNVQLRYKPLNATLTAGSCRVTTFSYTPTAYSMAFAIHPFAPSLNTAGAVWPVPALCHVPADVNRDGTVNGADLGMLLGGWNSAVSLLDLDGNGIVAGGDLGVLLGAWGQGG